MIEFCKRLPGSRTTCAGCSRSVLGSLHTFVQNASNQTFG
jgi:hypothetical protein